MPEIKEILQEYVATANNPEYKSNFDVINSKFPELNQYDKALLQEYVATANNPKYNSNFDVINSKFPELFSVKKKEPTTLSQGVGSQNTSKSASTSPSPSTKVPDFKNMAIPGVTGLNTFKPLTEQQKNAGTLALGQGTTIVEPQRKQVPTPQESQRKSTVLKQITGKDISYDDVNALADPTNTNYTEILAMQKEKPKTDNAYAQIPAVKTEQAQISKEEREKNNPFSTVNLADKYKKSAKQLSGNNDVEKLLNYGEISGYNKFVVDLLDDNDKELYQVKLGMEDIGKSNKIYDAQLKSGAITPEQYDAVKKNNDKLLIDLNTAYVDKLKKRNSDIDEQIKEAQQQLADGIYTPENGVYKKLTPQEAQDKKEKIKYLTGLKNDVLVDINNPVKSLEKHSGYQQAEKEGLIPNNATNTQKLKIYSNILAYKANALAKELGYDTKDAKSLLGDNFLDANGRKMAWESFKSLIVGSSDKEKEFVKTMGELQAIAPIVVLNKNNLTLNEGYTSNIVSSFRKSVAPMFSRNQIATDEDRSRLTNEAFAGAGISNDGVSADYVAKQEDTKKESESLSKTVARTTGDVLGIGVKIGVINPILELPAAGIEMATGTPIIKGLNKALSTSKQAQAVESATLGSLAETAKTAKEISQIKEAQKVLDIAKVVSEKIPNNFLTRTLYNTVKAGTVHEIQGEVNKELEGFANFGVGAINNLIGMPINYLGNIAIKMFGKDAPMLISRTINALKSGTAMTGTMAGMVTVNAAQESKDFDAFKDVLNEHFGTSDKRLRFVAENFLLGLVMHAANADNISGGFKTAYEKMYSELSEPEKKKMDEFTSTVNEETNNFETETKDALEKEDSKDEMSTMTDVKSQIADKISNGGIESLNPEEVDYYNNAKEDIDKLITGETDLSYKPKIKEEEKIELPAPTPEVTPAPLLDEQQITEELNKDLQTDDKVTPTELIDKGQEQNNSQGLQGELENNQGNEQGVGIGQDVSNQVEVPQVEQVQEEIKPIKQLGNGSNVYFETPKYRVNDGKDGVTYLNVYDNSGNLTPALNAEFDNVNDAIRVAKILETEFPEGVPPEYATQQYIDTIKNEGNIHQQMRIANGVENEITPTNEVQTPTNTLPDGEIADGTNGNKGNEITTTNDTRNGETKTEITQPTISKTENVEQVDRKSPEQKLQDEKHDRLVSLMRDYNSTPSNNKNRKTELRQKINKLSGDLGYTVKGKLGDKLDVLNNNGKVIRKISTINNDAEITKETFDKVKAISHWFEWNGDDLTHHIDASKLGLTWQEIRRAKADIDSGKTSSTNINRVANAINEYSNMESLPLVKGFGGQFERLDVSGDDLLINEVFGNNSRNIVLLDAIDRTEFTDEESEQLSEYLSNFTNADGEVDLDKITEDLNQFAFSKIKDYPNLPLEKIQNILSDENNKRKGQNQARESQNSSQNDTVSNEQEKTTETVGKTDSNIGIKRKITDARRESLGLEPVELPKLIAEKAGITMAKDAVDNGFINPMETESEIIKHENDPTYAKASRFDLEVLKYRRLQLEQKEKSLIQSKIDIDNELSKNPDNADLIAQQLLIQEHINNNLQDMEQNTLASRIASNVFANLGQGLQTEYNLEGEIQLLVKKIKNNFGDNIPKDVQEKLNELQQQNKELIAKNEQIQKEYESKDNLKTKEEFDEAVKKEVEKISKERSSGAIKEKNERLKGKDLIASGVDKVASALGVRLMAEGTERPSLIQGLAEIGQGLIDEGSATIGNVINKLGEYLSDKFGDKINFEDYREDVRDLISKNIDKSTKSIVNSEKIDDLSSLLKSKMEELVKKGITNRDEIVKTIHDDLKRIYTENDKNVDFDIRKIRDILSDYGKEKKLSQDPIDKQVRDIKRQMKLASAIEDVLLGNAPLKSGMIPDKMSDIVRRMKSEVRDLMKKNGIETSTQEQKWATALDAIKTRLRNEIKDLEYQRDNKERFTKKTNGVTYDAEALELKEQRDTLKDVLDSVIGKEYDIKQTINEIKRIAKEEGATVITKSMVKRSLISDLIRLNLETGVESKDVLAKTLESLKDAIPDTTEQQLQDAFLRKNDFKTESKTKTQLQKDLADLKSQLSTQQKIDNLKNGIAAEIKKQGEKSEAVQKLQKDLAEQKRKSLNEFANLSAVELQRQINITQNKINKGEFAVPKNVKAKFQSDANWVKNNQKLTNIKLELKKLEAKSLDEKKSTFMKALDTIDRWAIRSIFFGSQAYQLKLASSAVSSIIHKPIEDLLGGMIYNNAFKNISKNAPIEGSTKNSLSTLGDYYKSNYLSMETLKSWKDILLHGETKLGKEMDKMYSPNKFLDFDFGNKNNKQKIGEFLMKTVGAEHIPIIDLLTTDPHAMIKEPIKRGTYKSAYNAYMKWVAENMGADAVNEPLVIETAKNAAYLKAKSEIFMGNSLSENGTTTPEGWAGFLERLNNNIMASRTEAIVNKDNTQYALSSLYKFFLPIVKVPTNIITRAIKGNPIVLTKKIIEAININSKVENGDLKITTDEADAIIRDLKKGTVTSAYWIAGFLLAGAVAGGFYNPFYSDEERKRRSKKIAKSNEINLGQEKHSVTDLMIHGTEHTSQITALMLGATFWVTLKHYQVDEKEGLDYAIAVASAATLKATGEQHPVFNFSSRLINATQSEKGLKRFGNDIGRRFDVERMMKINPIDYYKGKLKEEKKSEGSNSVKATPVKVNNIPTISK